MKRQIRFLSIAFVLFFICGNSGLFAQQKYEFSGYGGLGLSTLSYETTAGEQKSGFGENFGFGAQYFFRPNWSLGSGLEFAFYNAKFTADNLKISYTAYDTVEETDFEFRSTALEYEEKQSVTMLQIPLLVKYRTAGKRPFNVGAGVKIGIPMSGKYDATASLHNAGYYAYENSLYDTQNFRGFGDFPDRKSDGDLNFKTAIFISAEAGIKLKQLNGKVALHAGAYLDYGLNNIAEEPEESAAWPYFVEYNTANPPAFKVNSVFKSRHGQAGGAARAFTDTLKPSAAGIKVWFTFGNG